MRSATLLSTLVFTLLLTAGAALAPNAHAQIYVDRDASGANDGTSWSDAYTDLQDAIDAATGSDQIWIAEGTYLPRSQRSGTVQFSYLAYRKRSFVIPDSKDGLKLYGGFNGSETALDQRDPAAHEVILSGDLGPDDDAPFDPDTDSDEFSNTHPSTDHLRAGLPNGAPERGWGGNVNHVVFLGGGLSRSTVIDGVTITGGFAVAQFFTGSDFIGGQQRNYGGGLFCDGCSATVRGVTFRGNYAAERGGAVYVRNSGSPHFINTVFWGNNAGGQPPTFSDPPGDRDFQFYFVSGPGDTNGQPVAEEISNGFGAAVYNDGSSPDIDFSTFYQHPDPNGEASTLENTSGDDVLFADGRTDIDRNPSSSTFLQIDTETSALVDAGSTGRLPDDTEDLDGDGDTSEPLPIDARGNERIQGLAPDPGAYESPFSTAPNPGPAAIAVGERLPIVGRGVDAATAVRINGTPATNLTGTGDGNQRITVTVAEGTTSGLIEIDTPGGTIKTEESVEVTPPAYGPGQALGASGSVELSNESAFDFPTPENGSSGFTISLWTKGSFSVQKEVGPNGWRLSGSPGGEATFFVNFEGEDDAGNTTVRNVAASIRVPDDGQWHHVAATYQFNDDNEGTHIAKFYVDGVKQRASRTGDDLRLTNTRRPSTDDAPVTIDAGGAMDQVRVYDRALAESDLLTDNSTSDAAELNVRRRIHRTADLSDGQYSGLIAEYRFDSGDPNTAFDYAGRNSGTYQNGAGTIISTAPVGQDAGANPIGPDGASLGVVSVTDQGDISITEFTGLYRYGNSDAGIRTSSDPGEVFDSALPDGLSERAALTWGAYREPEDGGLFSGFKLSDVEYGSVTSLSGSVGLLYREKPGAPWRVADWFAKDPSSQTLALRDLFDDGSSELRVGEPTTPPGEYALASFPFSDLRLTLTPETQSAASGETATFTATLTNDGPDDVPGVTVDFDATNLSGLSASGGTFSGGTWDVGTLAGGASTNITLTATVESGADLPALHGALGLNDINNGNNAAQAVVPASPAYGPGQALAFDGSDDYMNLGSDIRLDSRSFTISFWAKRASTGSEHTIISQGGNSDEALHIGFRSDGRLTAGLGGNAVTTDAPTDTDWHHWTVLFDENTANSPRMFLRILKDGQQVKSGNTGGNFLGAGDLVVGRLAYENGQHFSGHLDQLRIWGVDLTTDDLTFDPSLTRARMHQRLAPGNPKAEFLLASYRFDEGRGTVAHSAGQGPLATFEGNPQWVPFSAARLGEESAVATSSTDASIGPAGAQLSATSASGDVQLYRYGRAPAPLRTESDPGEALSGLPTGITERSHQTWGVAVPGGTSPNATLTLDYSSAIGTATTPAPPVRLIRRDAPGEPWQVAAGWTKDTAAQTFTSTGTVQTGEYALVTLPYADLAVRIDPPAPVASGEDAAFTVTLTNTGPDASVAAAVDLSTNAELGTLTPGTPSAGSVSGTTWTVGALASGASATLEVTAPFAGPEPGTLTSTATDADSFDPQEGNNAGTATVITPPYGPETALAFDGDGDVVQAPIEQDPGPFTAEAWVQINNADAGTQGIINRDVVDAGGEARSWKLGLDSDGATLELDVFTDDTSFETAAASEPLAEGTWHHVVGVFDGTNLMVYVNGTKVGEQPLGASTWNDTNAPLRIGTDACCDDRDFNGEIDQVRVWNTALTEAEIRARMHRTVAPEEAAFDDLIASYRFDVGTGTTAYDYAGSNPASFEGDPQWTDFSGARLGQEQVVATENADAEVGPSDAVLRASSVSDGDVQLYRYGTADGPLRTDGDPGEGFGGVSSERSNLTWGIAAPDGSAPTADLTLDYSGASTLPDGDVTLVRRDHPGDDWTFASGWGHDKGNQRFLFSGAGSEAVPTGEYAIADVPPPEVTTNEGLTLDQGTPAPLTQSDLETTDVNDDPGDLEYTITSGPDNGQLLVFGQPLGESGPPGFSQRQINNGDITYVSDGTDGTDTFDFEVSDGAETVTGTFTITVDPNDAYGTSGGFVVGGEDAGGSQPVGDTGVLLDLQTVPGFGSGFVHVVRYDDAPANAESIDRPNVGTSRYVITTLGRLQVDAGTVLKIAADLLPHHDPSSVTIYQRSSEGSGSFTDMPTTYDPSANVVETTVDSFSEFATAASDVFSVPVAGQEGTGNDTGFRMLAFPNDFERLALEDDLDFDVSSGSLLQTFPGGGPDGSDWVELTESSDTVERSQGFILYFFDDATDPIEFPGITLDVPDTGLDFTQDVTTPALDINDEYEVLGNPFDEDIDLSETLPDLQDAGFSPTIAVWDPALRQYQLITQGDPEDTLPAFNGFVLQRTTVGSGATDLTFAATGRTGEATAPIGTEPPPGDDPVIIESLAGASADGAAAPTQQSATESAESGTPLLKAPTSDSDADSEAYVVALQMEAMNDPDSGANPALSRGTARLRVSETATTDWDAHDFRALPPPATDDEYALVGFPLERSGQDAVLRAVASEPLSIGSALELEVPLHVEGVGLAGPAAIAWPTERQVPDLVPDDWTVELVDTQPDIDTQPGGGSDPVVHDLRTGGPYLFELAEDDAVDVPDEARFRLRISAAPLPVELAQFEARRARDEAVTLQWETLSETNNAGFEVQRRAPQVETPPVETPQWDVSTGESWQTIARLEGAGTTDTPQSYQFEDADLPYAADSLSYRLRQVDTDGTASVTEAVTIARPVTDAELLPSYPNPARSQATIRYAVPERQDVRIVLYDLLGRRVQTVVHEEAEGRTEQVLDVSRLASGTYFLRMQTEGHTETQRLTVVR